MTTTPQGRCVAFLRAINVGGRRVKKDALIAPFKTLGLEKVEAFIASGNIAFDTPRLDLDALSAEIEASLLRGLGFEVDTFVRTAEQVRALAAMSPFPHIEPGDKTFHVYVAFTHAPPPQGLVPTLAAHVEAMLIQDREVFWLHRRDPGAKGLSGALLERALGGPATVRNINTLQRIAAKILGDR